jgi:dihydropyrimidinase
MQYDIVIKGGELISSRGRTHADLGIIGETIAAVGRDLEGREVLDATGKLVFPGALDVHTHFQLPFCGTVSADDFVSGSKAAALGGVTTFIDFAIQAKPASVMDAIRARRAEADPKVCVDYGLHAGITDWNEERVREFGEIVAAGCPTFKMFMIYKGQGWQSNDGDLFGAIREAKRYGGMVGVHAENNDLIELLQSEVETADHPGCYSHAVTRPTVTESEAISRAIQIAEAADGALYIFHLSTGKASSIVRKSRRRGINVHAETGPQYLLLDDELFKREDGHHFGTCPPIRKPADQETLWRRLAEDDLEVMATDTCTFNSTQKAMWNGDYKAIPFGMPGIETMVPLTYTAGVREGRLTLEQMIAVLCENPARLMGLWPRKGSLTVGADADVVIFDPDCEVTITPEVLATNCDYSPFEGTTVTGWPQTTLLRGQVIVRDRIFTGAPGQGRFLHRNPPFAPVDGEE